MSTQSTHKCTSCRFSLHDLLPCCSAASATALFVMCLSSYASAADNRIMLHDFIGETAGDNFGWVSSPIPDVNSDGAQDVIVTSPFNDEGGNNAGKVYLYSGRTGEELWQYTNTTAGETAGFSARDAGDVDGDLVCDVIIGAPGTGAGRAYVLSGVDGHVILALEGQEDLERFGAGVTGIGDVNNDQVNDVAVGAENNKAVFGNAGGRVYLLSGVDGSVIDTIDAETEFDKFGHSLANLGDIDHDNVNDLVIGAPKGNPQQNGRAYVYSGKTRTLIHTLDPTGSNASGFTQYFIASSGDVNKDGTNDIYISDFADTTNGGNAGKAYVFDGADGSVLHEWLGQQGDGFGIGRGCGDVNGDGHADLLLAGWAHGGGAPGAGRAQVFSGADGSIIRTFTSIVAGEGFGFDAHGIGDANNDGHLDFFVTAAYNNEVGARAGKCYLISGQLTTQPFAPGIPGRDNIVEVNGATPGKVVYLIAGVQTGSRNVPGCSGVTVGINKPTIIGKKRADLNGNASFSISVPSALKGKTVHTQAVEPATCVVSNLETLTFPK